MSFREYLRSFKSTWGVLSALALVLAGTLKFTDLVPPWPDAEGIGASALAGVSCLVGVAVGYFLPFKSKQIRTNFGIALVLLSLPLVLLYLYMLSSRVITVTQPQASGEAVFRVIIGTEVRLAADEKKSPADLIEAHGVRAEAWTHQSVTNSRILLLSTYMLFYLVLTCGFGSLQGMKRQ